MGSVAPIDRCSFSVALHISDRIVQCHKEDVYSIVVGVVSPNPKMRLPTLIATVVLWLTFRRRLVNINEETLI